MASPLTAASAYANIARLSADVARSAAPAPGAAPKQDARALLGDIWTDRKRVICHGPSPLELCPLEIARLN
jgi:hypothetical protein